MKSDIVILTAAVLIAIALVVSANILRPQVQKEIVVQERESFRFQFIQSELYKQFTVFDRKTGIVYQYGLSNDGEDTVSLAVDLPNAEKSFKPFSNLRRKVLLEN